MDATPDRALAALLVLAQAGDRQACDLLQMMSLPAELRRLAPERRLYNGVVQSFGGG